MAADTGRFPTNLATPTSPGAMSAADKVKLTALDLLAQGAVPAFAANAATVAPGTDKASEYEIESTRTLAAGSTLTVSAADSPVQGNVLIVCRALALGYTLSIVNGGPAAGTVATIAGTLTKPLGVALWFDGTNYAFNGYFQVTA